MSVCISACQCVYMCAIVCFCVCVSFNLCLCMRFIVCVVCVVIICLGHCVCLLGCHYLCVNLAQWHNETTSNIRTPKTYNQKDKHTQRHTMIHRHTQRDQDTHVRSQYHKIFSMYSCTCTISHVQTHTQAYKSI